MRRAGSRAGVGAAATLLIIALTACGSTTILSRTRTQPRVTVTTAAAPAPLAGSGSGGASESTPARTSTPQQLGFPYLATKNTTRVAGNDPISNAAAVAMSVFPSTAAGTHPSAITLAPADDWQAAVAAASLMGSPFRAPILLSTPSTLPTATASALDLLAPTGDASAGGVQVIRVGDVPSVHGLSQTDIGGASAFAIAANIDAFEIRQRHGASTDIVIASAENPAYAMPAAGWAAESGEPILYVTSAGVPQVTATELRKHPHAHIYVLGPSSVVSNRVVTQLRRYGVVKRISGGTAPAESVNFAEYRSPACPLSGQQCAHIPHSFGWAIRSPGHGYTLLNEDQPLDAAAAAALSASGGYGPQLLLAASNTLPRAVLNYFLDYATPGYNSEGPTAAVYNHAWLIGNESEITESVQAQVDSLLEVVPAG